MSFKNPKLVSIYVTTEDTQCIINYLSSVIRKTVNHDSVVSEVHTKSREYKSLSKIKNPSEIFSRKFLLPIFGTFNRKIDLNYFTSYIVECEVIYYASFTGIRLDASFKTPRGHYNTGLLGSDEFLFLLSINLNYFLTDFAKTFRLKPDPNISLKEYFDSYYQSGNFASIIENSNGEVLR